jgi:hypothetical protein
MPKPAAQQRQASPFSTAGAAQGLPAFVVALQVCRPGFRASVGFSLIGARA